MLYRSILPTHRSLDTQKCVSAASTLPSLSRFLVNQSNLDGLAGLAAGQDHSIGHRPDRKKMCPAFSIRPSVQNGAGRGKLINTISIINMKIFSFL